MSDRSLPSNGETPETNTGLQKHLGRRSILRKAAATTAAVSGLTGVTSVAASDYAETLNGYDITSYGDRDSWKHEYDDGKCRKAEVSIGSAIDGNSATYSDDPAPVMCNWCANAEGGNVTSDNLEMTVSIENTGDGWNISGAKTSKEEAPDDIAYEPSFDIGVSWMGFGFSYSFSENGTSESIDCDWHSVS